MDEIRIPDKCSHCKCMTTYDSGCYSRNPHCCCELRWILFREDYRVDPTTLDDKCPLVKFSKGDIKFKDWSGKDA